MKLMLIFLNLPVMPPVGAVDGWGDLTQGARFFHGYGWHIPWFVQNLPEVFASGRCGDVVCNLFVRFDDFGSGSGRRASYR